MTESRLRGSRSEYKYSGNNPPITEDFLNYLVNRDCCIKVIRILPLGYEKNGANPLNLMDIQRLAKALERNISVHTVDFANILETEEFANDPIKRNKAIKAVASLLRKNTHIETVFLDGNPISSIGGFYLTEALKNSNLQHLSMNNCQFASQADIAAIVETFADSNTIQLIALAGVLSQKELKGVSLHLLKLYQKHPQLLWFDKEAKNVFEQMIAERQMIEARTHKTVSEKKLAMEKFPPMQEMIKHPHKRIKMTSAKSMDPLPEVKEVKQGVSENLRLTLNRYSRHASLNMKTEVGQITTPYNDAGRAKTRL